MRVHLVGVSGTGMGQLAMLLAEAGHEVSGSDVSFDPPMGPALEAANIRCLRGYDAANVQGSFDRVVVGNAIRAGNVEAARAEELGIARASMSATLRELFLVGRRPLVVAGTHGKTTTSAMCAWILAHAGQEPGYFIGGLPKNFPSGAAIGQRRRKITPNLRAPASPFVVEGDEYDAVYWHKQPKFFDYVGVGDDDVVIVTSIEQDHIDIYPTAEGYEAVFVELARRVPSGGLLVHDVHDARARAIVGASATDARKISYALASDGDLSPNWLAVPVPSDDPTRTVFDVFAHGANCGTFTMAVPGLHNVRNALGALAATVEGFGVPVATARTALATFEGVRRRQDRIGTPGGVTVYDDFAHHPTAVAETLRALRARHPGGRLWAVFEPRSATACRALHQREYVDAFAAADRVIFAPLGRSNVPEAERLDTSRLAREIGDRALAAANIDDVVATLASSVRTGDTVALLSNGSFGGIHGRLLEALGKTPDAG